MRPSLLTRCALVILGSITSGCVSSARYDSALKTANDARIELKEVRASDAETIIGLQLKVSGISDEDAKLHAELARLGITAGALSLEKGAMSLALRELRARMAELARAREAAEARAKTYRDLALRLKSMTDAGDLTVALREGRMVIQLPTDVLFDSGRVDIKRRGRVALKQLEGVLATMDGRRFQVAGHTDNVPIETPRYRSNWELSTARGVEVVRLLIEQGMKANVVAAAGYGEFDPVASNDSPLGRARNRRIEITLQPNIDELIGVPESP
jgi:chemotaxis protein MotB